MICLLIEKMDSVLDKTHLINYYWSGKHKKVLKGINLITLYHTGKKRTSIPINYRLYDPDDVNQSNPN